MVLIKLDKDIRMAEGVATAGGATPSMTFVDRRAAHQNRAPKAIAAWAPTWAPTIPPPLMKRPAASPRASPPKPGKAQDQDIALDDLIKGKGKKAGKGKGKGKDKGKVKAKQRKEKGQKKEKGPSIKGVKGKGNTAPKKWRPVSLVSAKTADNLAAKAWEDLPARTRRLKAFQRKRLVERIQAKNKDANMSGISTKPPPLPPTPLLEAPAAMPADEELERVRQRSPSSESNFSVVAESSGRTIPPPPVVGGGFLAATERQAKTIQLSATALKEVTLFYQWLQQDLCTGNLNQSTLQRHVISLEGIWKRDQIIGVE